MTGNNPAGTETLMTNRPTSQVGIKKPKGRSLTEFAKYKGRDSFALPTATVPCPGGGAPEEQRRISRRQLENSRARLSERDRNVLVTLEQYRYLTTDQVQRLHFTDSASHPAALRAASRTLKKLREMGLAEPLSRRIGGVRAGSSSLVWRLTHAGKRLLRLDELAERPLTRFFEPSPYFLAHSLAVAETAIQIREICGEAGTELVSLQLEPECWRPYSNCGVTASLKPDLYALTVSDQYEDRWFFEIDLDTESPAKVLEKCHKYHDYYRSGLEQESNGMFPLVVWIVPDRARKESLFPRIREEFEKWPRIFCVATADELGTLIYYGGDDRFLC